VTGFVVRVKYTAYKDVIVDGCTEEQAQQSPFDHAVDELPGDTVDFEVISVHPND
jgi:hypothetical protein